MAKKLGTKKEVTIEGVKYTFQHPGTEAALDIQDRAVTKTGGFSSKKMAEELFKHVIIEPKVSFDYFDEHDGFDEVFEEAFTFLRT
ncbi:hypothetical protein [Domibacillus iocasae]|uniref:Phage protein n=1 Tax=Domibacillus iocasae TaxID=1714016 RepID=A0A1E7DRB3_9BACI|nr:hypothetical protein [Domibacillus iocasae]OES45228.1 hypothetical protein BA724_04260 [Domibacillus iocasae]